MGDNEIFFSIIVPIYNIEKYLRECIESVLTQDFLNYELILVDDGSTDRSVAICDEYACKDERIIVIHKQNGGLVSARQAGCKIAKGLYCLCLDGDDWVEKNYLETLYKIAKEEAPDIIAFNYYESNENIKREILTKYHYGMYYRPDIENNILPKLIYSFGSVKFNYSIWSKAFKRELYVKQQLKLDQKIKIGEDLACVIPCVYDANSIYFERKCLYNYRYNPSSMTKNKKSFRWDGMELIYTHFLNCLPMDNFNFEDQINQKVFHELVNIIKTQFYRNISFFELRKEIQKNINNNSYKKVIKESKFPISSIYFYFKLFIRLKIFFPFYILSKVK
ncbi:MAG: glycosyltransferase family 2 protein [Clostridia bacterium]|nr:glycosyltransferase family 2 protein [Clostridia bacterium]